VLKQITHKKQLHQNNEDNFGYHWIKNQVNPLKTFPPKFIYGNFPSKVMKQQGKGRYCIALHYNPIVKPCSSKLNMSYQGESLLQEFQHFLESL